MTEESSWEEFGQCLETLVNRFDDLMSFGLHVELVERTAVREKIERLAELLDVALGGIERSLAQTGASEAVERVAEDTRDCLWQIREEVLGNADRAAKLSPIETDPGTSTRARRFVAWAVEQVIENLDRLEVRGRDSAGLAIQCLVSAESLARVELHELLPALYESASRTGEGVEISTNRGESVDGQGVITFVFKVANLVGRLGDNTSALRNAINGDELLWSIADVMIHLNVIAHTRWASNGIISLANSHPVDGVLAGREQERTVEDRLALFVLNGDVDNYPELVQQVVRENGYEIDAAVTTDAKILPLVYRLDTDPQTPPEERFAHLMNTCEGSLAVVMQHPRYPRALYLGQKGSGQSLFIGKISDGFVFASEVYGLAALTRHSYALSGTEKGGTYVVVSGESSDQTALYGRFLEDGTSFSIQPEAINIHSRDIYRGAYDYYFEKEIHQASSSVRKTIKGKYRKEEGKINFITEGHGSFGRLLSRFRDPGLPPIRRIMVIGQGTASIAAQGVAYLIQRALARSSIVVDSCKASEMSGFLSGQPLTDMLLVAISQSGTTTDTNRTVDVAGSKEAWIHAIVNRRNSPLVSKADSHSYTSDGRDVEMAVASTKAFYSQVAAGKLVALLLAAELNSLTDEEIYQEIEDLEKLPSDIEWVLDQRESIRECAESYGPSSRNWAVVGNGPNKIAADEIRIKLSELCYKSIPCDITEDKKHIDLSTEPLTLVVANDLPEQIVQDTVKEVAIFKAHNGKPIVLCTRGEKRFTEYAERLIELPHTAGGLGFVPATVAGHLWGFYAARAIDAGAERLRQVRAALASVLEEPGAVNTPPLVSLLTQVMEAVASGQMNASLPASTVASLAVFTANLAQHQAIGPDQRQIVERGVSLLTEAVEESTRPIDSIRHQAKTVTVGISRPQEILPAAILRPLESLSVSPSQLKKQDVNLLNSVSPVISGINGGLLYRVVKMVDGTPVSLTGETPWIELITRIGSSIGKPSRYDAPKPAGGSKRTALRLERAAWSPGRSGLENLIVIPLFDENKKECQALALFHLDFVPQASLQQKIALLRELGNRYHEVIERLEELSNSSDLEDFLERISPRDLVLAPIDSLILSEAR